MSIAPVIALPRSEIFYESSFSNGIAIISQIAAVALLTLSLLFASEALSIAIIISIIAASTISFVNNHNEVQEVMSRLQRELKEKREGLQDQEAVLRRLRIQILEQERRLRIQRSCTFEGCSLRLPQQFVGDIAEPHPQHTKELDVPSHCTIPSQALSHLCRSLEHLKILSLGENLLGDSQQWMALANATSTRVESLIFHYNQIPSQGSIASFIGSSRLKSLFIPQIDRWDDQVLANTFSPRLELGIERFFFMGSIGPQTRRVLEEHEISTFEIKEANSSDTRSIIFNVIIRAYILKYFGEIGRVCILQNLPTWWNIESPVAQNSASEKRALIGEILVSIVQLNEHEPLVQFAIVLLDQLAQGGDQNYLRAKSAFQEISQPSDAVQVQTFWNSLSFEEEVDDDLTPRYIPSSAFQAAPWDPILE